MWDFSTEPEYQERLDWAARFVREECEAMDLLFPGGGAPYDVGNAAARAHQSHTYQQRLTVALEKLC